eukprot:comp23693_c0_seq1/m.40683 comp23693_c0_seq1/g.40683  ORF comp23693_c0_seq1/g.40683 comp23693_c0_seq1/m.40683 type:complete len:391 (+) comp23693_c0_seq1:1489-2661(+)
MRALHTDNPMGVAAHLNLKLGRVSFLIGAYTLNLEPIKDLQTIGDHGGVFVDGGEVEVFRPTECEHLGAGNLSIARKHGSLVILLPICALPHTVHRIGGSILDGKVTHTERGGEDGGLKGTATAHGFIGIQGGAGLRAKSLDNDVLDCRHTGTTTNNFHTGQLILLDPRIGNRLDKGLLNAGENVSSKRLERGSVDAAVEVQVVAQALDVDGDGATVCTHQLLHLLALLHHAEARTGLLVQVDLVLVLELLLEVLVENIVEVTATKMLVCSRGLDRQLALDECSNSDLHGGVANVHQSNIAWLVLVLRKILLVDAVGQCRCCGVVHEAKAVETGYLGGGNNAPTLGIIEPVGARDDDIHDGLLEFLLSRQLEFGQEHGVDLLGGEHVVLP